MLSHVQLFVTLWTEAHQFPLPMGILQARILEGAAIGVPFPPPGDLPDPGTEPVSLMSPALAGGFFTTGATWEAHKGLVFLNYFGSEKASMGSKDIKL